MASRPPQYPEYDPSRYPPYVPPEARRQTAPPGPEAPGPEAPPYAPLSPEQAQAAFAELVDPFAPVVSGLAILSVIFAVIGATLLPLLAQLMSIALGARAGAHQAFRWRDRRATAGLVRHHLQLAVSFQLPRALRAYHYRRAGPPPTARSTLAAQRYRRYRSRLRVVFGVAAGRSAHSGGWRHCQPDRAISPDA